MSAPTVSLCLQELIRNPQETLLRRWNWKASLFSSVCRATLFFAVNASSGVRVAAGAMLTEFLYRSLAAGFYGALIQQFRLAEPRWAAAFVVGAGVPVISHSIEFVIHWMRGTPHLFASILASAAFTVLSTLFNLHAMRQGFLLAGEEQASLAHDLRALPRLLASLFSASTGK